MKVSHGPENTSVYEFCSINQSINPGFSKWPKTK